MWIFSNWNAFGENMEKYFVKGEERLLETVLFLETEHLHSLWRCAVHVVSVSFVKLPKV